VKTVEFFWKLHNFELKSWKQEAIVNDEETQMEGKVYSRQVEGFASNCTKTVKRLKNATLEDCNELLNNL